MYDFTGCECVICHQRFKLEENDVVVCPDCGTPYHRACYQTMGHCKNEAAHSSGFEWQPPELNYIPKRVTCPRCQMDNEKTNEYCKKCGLSLASFEDEEAQCEFARKKVKVEPRNKAQEEAFDQLNHGLPPYGKPLNQNETFEGIPVAEWVSYIGMASPSYLSTFQQMKLLKRKYSFSFSAMLFGPLYFFYRKAWDIALCFSAIALLLNLPTFLMLLVYSESAFAPNISDATLTIFTNVSVALSWAFMMLRGLYGTYLYKISSAKTIKKIKARTKDPKQKAFLLHMYGGTSLGAVALVMAAVMILATMFSALVGPDLETMLDMLYY